MDDPYGLLLARNEWSHILNELTTSQTVEPANPFLFSFIATPHDFSTLTTSPARDNNHKDFFQVRTTLIADKFKGIVNGFVTVLSC